MKCTILYEDEDAKLSEYYDPNAKHDVLCVEINRWSLSAYKKYLNIFVKNLNKDYISYVAGPKEKKFNELFGFVPTDISFERDGKTYEVMYVSCE